MSIEVSMNTGALRGRNLKCHTCGQSVDEGSAAAAEQVILTHADGLRHRTWSDLWREPIWLLANAQGVAKVAETDYEDFGGEQGATYSAWMVFEVDGQHWRKEGTADSYGDVEWLGPFERVTPNTKTATYFS